jgi:putative ABC transport system permease protein
VSIGQDPAHDVAFHSISCHFGRAKYRAANSTWNRRRHKAEVHEVDKDLPVTDVVSMSDLIDTSVAQPRFRTWLLGSFAVMALVLAAAGIFGVISSSVSRRTHEIGIRVTLGASPANVMRLILTESARLVLIGLAVGVPVALGLGRFLSNLLFGIHAADPTTFTAVAFILFTVAI